MNSWCAECNRSVAREDRVEVDGEVYHRQCAPDHNPVVEFYAAEESDGGRSE
jgi:hypothetical protein